MENNQLLSAKETAHFLRISLTTMYRLIKESKIPYYRIGRQLFFNPVEVLEAFRNNNTHAMEAKNNEDALFQKSGSGNN